jgi:Transglutaminase-like superfamily
MSLLNHRTHFHRANATEAATRLPTLFFLIPLAFVYLVRFDLLLARSDFASICDQIRQFAISGTAAPNAAELLCKAMDLAAIGYWKRILCLQRSTATTCFLRRFGVPAQVVIGSQQMPFKAHAWVEVDGRVVNDRAYMREMYTVLDCW